MTNPAMSVPFMLPMTQQQALQQQTLFAQPNPFLQATYLVPVQVPLDPRQQFQQQQQAQQQLANTIRGHQLQLQLQQRTQQDLQHQLLREQKKKEFRFEFFQKVDEAQLEELRAERSSHPLTIYPPPAVQSRPRYHGRNSSISSAHSSRSHGTFYSPSTSQSQSMQGSPRTSSALSGHVFPDMQRLSLASQASSQSLGPSYSQRRPSVAPFQCAMYDPNNPEGCKHHTVRTALGTDVSVNCKTFALNTGITASRYNPRGITPSRYHSRDTPTPVRSQADVDTREVEAAIRIYISQLALAIWHQSLPGASRQDPAIKDVDNRLVSAVLDLWLVTERKFNFRHNFVPYGSTLSGEDGGKGQGATFFFELGDSTLRWEVESFAETQKAQLEREMYAPKSITKEWIQRPFVGLAAGGKNGAGPRSGGGPIKLQTTLFKRTFIFLDAIEDFRKTISNRPATGRFRLVDTSHQELTRAWGYQSLDQVRSSGRFQGCLQCDKRTRCGVVRHPQTADWVCSGCFQYADPNKPQELEWSRKESVWRCDTSRISFPSGIQCGCLFHQRARLQSLQREVATKPQKPERSRPTEALMYEVPVPFTIHAADSPSSRKEAMPARAAPLDRHERPSVRFDERIKQMGQRSATPCPAALNEPTPAIKKRPSPHRWPRSILRFNSVMKTTVEEESSDTGSSGATSVDATFGSGASKGSSTPPSSRTSSDEDAIPRPS